MAKTTMVVTAARTVATMPEPLQKVYAKIQTLIAKDNQSGVMACYSIGLEIAKVQRGLRQFGEGAVASLAEAVGRPISMLWDCHRLTEVWTKPQIEALIVTPTSKGTMLSLTHLGQLAVVEDADQRQRLQEQCLEQAWSCKELLNQIHSSSGTRLSGGGRPPVAPKSALSGLQQSSKLIASLVNREESYDAAVFSKIDEMTDDQVNERLLEELTESHDRYEQLLTFAKTSIRKVDVALDRVRKLVDAKSGSAQPSRKDKPAGTRVQPVSGKRQAARAASAKAAEPPAAVKPAAGKPTAAKPAAAKPALRSGRQATDFEDDMAANEVMPPRKQRPSDKKPAVAVLGKKKAKSAV